MPGMMRKEIAQDWRWRGKPKESCSQCGHRDRDYRLPLGICEDVGACDRRIVQARSVKMAPPVDETTCRDCGSAKEFFGRRRRILLCRTCHRQKCKERRTTGAGIQPIDLSGARERLGRFLDTHWNQETILRLADLLGRNPNFGESYLCRGDR